MAHDIIERRESAVRVMSRRIPEVFSVAKQAVLTTTSGKQYIDLFIGGGVMNYGHNSPEIVRAMVEYLNSGGPIQSLDMATTARIGFLKAFEQNILEPRGLDYKIQFTGPTGANAVEAALKLARKITGRSSIVAFTGAYHGMSLGALAVSATNDKRHAAGVPLAHTIRLPYDEYLGGNYPSASLARQLFTDRHSGVEPPAAFLVEIIQAKGGMNAASRHWLYDIAALARQLGALFIVDEIFAGCGRTGRFFSFEDLGFDQPPDIVCLSKALSGSGLPLSALLIKPEFDRWSSGDHVGTFRSNALALTTGAVACGYWTDPIFLQRIDEAQSILSSWLDALPGMHPAAGIQIKGRGFMRGLRFAEPAHARAVAARAFERGVLIETCGPLDEVLELLPPINIEPDLLRDALQRLGDAIDDICGRSC